MSNVGPNLDLVQDNWENKGQSNTPGWCIKRNGVLTKTVLKRFHNGMSTSDIMRDLKLKRVEVEEAIRLQSAIQLEELQASIKNAHEKNIKLDALHFVWCSGGCEGGVHWHNKDLVLTEEIVEEAERNTTRLRSWFESALPYKSGVTLSYDDYKTYSNLRWGNPPCWMRLGDRCVRNARIVLRRLIKWWTGMVRKKLTSCLLQKRQDGKNLSKEEPS